jgi:hypothetical protein
MILPAIPVKTAARECRSMIGAYLSPIADSSLFSWAVEGTFAQGWMNDRNIRNGIIMVGFDYRSESGAHQFYGEGAWKDWYNSAGGPGKKGKGAGYESFPKRDKEHFGPREFFYKYRSSETEFTAGLQTMSAGDYFLVDERVFGAQYTRDFGGATIDVSLASVVDRISRMGDVCGVRHLYNLLRGGRVEFADSMMFRTNLLGAVIRFDPHYEKPPESDDEFGEFSEFGEFEENSRPFVEEYGFIYYQEFGEGFHDYKYYFGALAEINLPSDIVMKTEAVYQYLPGDRTVVYMAEAEKPFTWADASNTNIRIGWFGQVNIDPGYFYPAFSNLFLGEVVRLDAIDLPAGYASIRHSFPGESRLYIKLRAVAQTQKNHIAEFDLESGVKFLEHFKLSSIFSLINADALEETTWLARFELRAAI